MSMWCLVLLFMVGFSYQKTLIWEDGHPYLLIYVSIPANELTFIRQDTEFVTNFAISAYMRHGEVEIGDIYIDRKAFPEYETTVSYYELRSELKIGPFEPGEYTLEVELRDLQTQAVSRQREIVKIPDKPESELTFSTPIFIAKKDSVILGYLIFNVYDFRENKTPFAVYYKIGDRTDSIILSGDKVTYPCTLYVRADEKQGTYQLRVGDKVYEDTLLVGPYLDWKYIDNYEVLSYIATSEEMDAFRKAKTRAEREQLWKEFWEKRDPTPGTPHNEYKETYLERVEYANVHFRETQEGWRTDRGRIYILLGPPDEVESHPFELEYKPYEIWYYYSRNMVFIFVDEHGFGDYILVYPPYYKL